MSRFDAHTYTCIRTQLTCRPQPSIFHSTLLYSPLVSGGRRVKWRFTLATATVRDVKAVARAHDTSIADGSGVKFALTSRGPPPAVYGSSSSVEKMTLAKAGVQNMDNLFVKTSS
jgi:hypothetical protein